MKSGKTWIFAPITVFALIASFQGGVANAGKSGDWFEIGPEFCWGDGVTDCSGRRDVVIGTADAVINAKGNLQLHTAAQGAIYSNGYFWIPNSRPADMHWTVVTLEAFRMDFPWWPTNRVAVTFTPDAAGASRTGYLAAYTARGALLVQKKFTTNGTTVTLDTGTTKSRIGYILASYEGAGGLLSTVRYWVSVH